MAQKKRSARPSGGQSSAGGPRRLGNQAATTRPTSAGAARRAARSRRRKSPSTGWLAVGVVVIVIVVFVIVRVTSGGNPAAGQSSGTDPALAPSSIVQPVTTVPAVVFNQVGTNKEPAPFELTATKTLFKSGGLLRFIYYGAEYCPYCALMRWSLVAALSRFGTFHNLKVTSSAASDGNIPTFSFLGSTYKSKYVVFSPYETEDRNRNALQTPPSNVTNLVAKYDFPPYQLQANEGGIPFFSFGNRFIADGDPTWLANLFSPAGTLINGGPGRQVIADALQNPFTETGKAVDGPDFIAMANYISAAICMTNGGTPATVCNSSGVQAAEKVLAKLKPTK